MISVIFGEALDEAEMGIDWALGNSFIKCRLISPAPTGNAHAAIEAHATIWAII